MNTEFLKDLGLGFLFVLSQVVFFQHLSLFGATADPLLFFLVWIISRDERIQMLFLAAILGLIQDGFLDFWGMFMFSKTLIIALVSSISLSTSTITPTFSFIISSHPIFAVDITTLPNDNDSAEKIPKVS